MTILRPTLMFGWFDRKHLGWLARFMQKAPVFPIHVPGKPIVPEEPETPKRSTVAQMDAGAVLPERFRGVVRQGSR